MTADGAETPQELVDAIARACAPTSRYWLHFHQSPDLAADHEIEIRIDVAPDAVGSFAEMPGWWLASSRPTEGMLFLRRFQLLTRDAVRAMLAEAVTLAYRHNGRFHSWTHERALLDQKTWNDHG